MTAQQNPEDPERPEGEDADAMGEASDADSGAGYGNHAVENDDD